MTGSFDHVDLVVDARAAIGESPTWVAEEGALYWIDIKAPALHRLVLADGSKRSWRCGSDIGAFALDGAGRALVALRDGLWWLDLADGALQKAVPAPFDPDIFRFNEGICDSVGRFWIGTMVDPIKGAIPDTKGGLYSFTKAAGLRIHGTEIAQIANGMAWSADGAEFFFAVSEHRTIYAYPYDTKEGRLGAARVFARLPNGLGIPDGAAVDAEGFYWCAIHGSGRLHRYTAQGELDRAVALPVSQPTMCAFAGPGLDMLYITSAREKLGAGQLAREPHAGGVFCIRPPARGLPRPWRVA